MQESKLVNFPPDRDMDLAAEVVSFLNLRSWLMARFGVKDDDDAAAAIRLFDQTVDPEIYHVHVKAMEPGATTAPSFKINPDANRALVEAGFYRFRYASLEEGSGQYTTTEPTLLQAWHVLDGTERVGPVEAVYFATITKIAGKGDSYSFFIIRRDDQGQWRLFRAYQLECPMDSRAWGLGNADLSADVLPGFGKLNPHVENQLALLNTQAALRDGDHPTPFRYGFSRITRSQDLMDLACIPAERPERLAAEIDALLFTPSP